MVNLSITKKGGEHGLQLKRRLQAGRDMFRNIGGWRFVARLVVFLPIMIVILIWALIVAVLDRVFGV